MTTLQAAIFDLDGLLIDSEPLWRRLEREVFAEVGVMLSEDDCRSTIGLRCDAVVSKWYEAYPWPSISPAEVQQRIEDRVCAVIRSEGQALAGVHHALEVVRDLGLLLAVASSSPASIIDAALERLEIGHLFPVRCSAAELAQGKPHPAVYLNAARTLEVSPASCVAFEDSMPGIESALAAGMKAIAIPDPAVEQGPFHARNVCVLPSLAELTHAVIMTLTAPGHKLSPDP